MNKTKYIIVAIAALALMGCNSDDLAQPTTPDGPTDEEVVLANVALVRAAADAWAAADDDGEYPTDVGTATTPGGMTLVDLLPNGELLVNPYTGEQSEPRDGAAANSGEIGYRHVPYGGAVAAFVINAWGDENEIASVDNEAELYAATIATAEIVRVAVEAFAANNFGIYPNDTGVDKDQFGNTVTDLLPDGVLQKNAFHLANTEPVDGAAATPGEIGYVPNSNGGYNLGFTVTAVGRDSENIYTHAVVEPDPQEAQVKVNCYRVLEAVLQWAEDSNGVYPHNIGVDTTPLGDTVVDLLGGSLIENPFTLVNTEPQDASAAQPGETGYLRISDGGVNVGFVITGYGANNVIITLSNQ